MLPTDTIDSVTPNRIAGWINILHGPLTSQCEATEVQFNMLLDIVLVYRAFALGHVAVSPEDFVMFADRLIRAASELHPFDRADEELADIAAWLRINFPKVCVTVDSLWRKGSYSSHPLCTGCFRDGRTRPDEAASSELSGTATPLPAAPTSGYRSPRTQRPYPCKQPRSALP